MNGQLAGIFKGSTQIGGLKDWDAEVSVNANKIANWKLTSKSYWLFDYPSVADKLTIKLYHSNGYWEGVGRVDTIPVKLINTLIHNPIEIIGFGILESKQ
jgi:hypothetical protein